MVTCPLTTFTVVPRPDSALTRVWCATVLTWTQAWANRGPVTILCTVLWMYPSTALVIDGPNDFSSPPSRVRPLSCSSVAACPVTPVTLRWLVIAVLTLSVSAFWTAGSWISGSMLAMYRPVSETWLAVHTAITETGARMQPTTIRTVATGPRQPGRRRRRWRRLRGWWLLALLGGRTFLLRLLRRAGDRIPGYAGRRVIAVRHGLPPAASRST